MAYQHYAKIAAGRGRERSIFPRDKYGERGLNRFKENPRDEQLKQIILSTEDIPHAKLNEWGERLLRNDLR